MANLLLFRCIDPPITVHYGIDGKRLKFTFNDDKPKIVNRPLADKLKEISSIEEVKDE